MKKTVLANAILSMSSCALTVAPMRTLPLAALLVSTLCLVVLAPVPPAPASGKVYALEDPLRSSQWALDIHQFASAPSDGESVVVAVIDTGVDASHPDLAGQVLPGRDFIDTSGDGRTDPNGHGTHVAGAIAALTDNSVGIAGAAPAARILPIRVLDERGEGLDTDVAQAIIWATDNGAQVINLSLGGDDNAQMAQAVAYAKASGVTLVAAAGNSGMSGNAPSYPAAYDEVIAVAAADGLRTTAAFSNHGPYVDIAAAGSAVLSTYPPDGYATMSGTSMAAPYVSAAAALLLSSQPSLSEPALRDRLLAFASDMGPSGWDEYSGAGLLNAKASLCACSAPPADVSPPSLPGLPGLPSLPDLPSLTLPALPSFRPGPFNPVLPSLPTLPSVPSSGQGLNLTLPEQETVAQGREHLVEVQVSDSSGPLPGVTVSFTGARSYSALTGRQGVAVLSVDTSRSARYAVRALTIDGRTSVRTYALSVSPQVDARRVRSKLVVSLPQPAGQLVRVMERGKKGTKVVLSKIASADGSSFTGSVRMRPKRYYQVSVSSSPGLVSWTSENFSLRGQR